MTAERGASLLAALAAGLAAVLGFCDGAAALGVGVGVGAGAAAGLELPALLVALVAPLLPVTAGAGSASRNGSVCVGSSTSERTALRTVSAPISSTPLRSLAESRCQGPASAREKKRPERANQI